MTRFKIILNPISNKGASAKLIPDICLELENYQLDFDLVQTECPGHAVELSQQAVREGFDTIVAAGGDGTINEVINGIMLAKEIGLGTAAIGVLPIGRGNDFNFSMGGAANWQEGCRVLADGKKSWIDIGRVKGGLYPEGRYFGNGVGVGFDAVVGFYAASQPVSGFLGYLIAALRTMVTYSPAPVIAIELETETITQSSLMVSVMNGRRMGGGFMMAPNGNPADGLFDLCIAEEVKKLKIFSLISLFLKGTQYEDAAIKGRQSANLTMRAVKGSLPVHADGETISTACDQIHIELLGHQLEMYLPEVNA